MAKKQKGKGTTPKGAVELKEAALDQASGGIYMKIKTIDPPPGKKSSDH